VGGGPSGAYSANPSVLFNNGSKSYNGISGWAQQFNLVDQFRPTNALPNGFKYEFGDNEYNYTVWGHGPNPSAPGDSYSYSNPTVSIYRNPAIGGGREYLYDDGTWGPRNLNRQHIPLVDYPFVQ
jgi:hypothetical protein